MIKECVVCGKFADMRGSSKTCGDECSKLLKKELNNKPEQRERNRIRMRKKYQTDPEYRKIQREYKQTPACRERQRKRDQQRSIKRSQDPIRLQYMRDWYKKNMQNPEFKERERKRKVQKRQNNREFDAFCQFIELQETLPEVVEALR